MDSPGALASGTAWLDTDLASPIILTLCPLLVTLVRDNILQVPSSGKCGPRGPFAGIKPWAGSPQIFGEEERFSPELLGMESEGNGEEVSGKLR